MHSENELLLAFVAGAMFGVGIMLAFGAPFFRKK